MSDLEQRLRERLRRAAAPGSAPAPRFEAIERRAGRIRQRRRVAAAAAAVVAVVGLGVVAAEREPDTTGVATGPATTTTSEAAATTTTTTPSSTTSTTDQQAPEEPDALYTAPAGWSAERTADHFARQWVGYERVVVGELRSGDAASGEVEIRSTATSPKLSTVLLRRIVEDRWSVLAVVTPDVDVERPTAGATVSDPVSVAGRGRAFEGTIEVEVRDRTGAVLGDGFVTGGCCAEKEPFAGDIAYRAPASGTGLAVAFVIRSAEDGGIVQVAVVPVVQG